MSLSSVIRFRFFASGLLLIVFTHVSTCEIIGRSKAMAFDGAPIDGTGDAAGSASSSSGLAGSAGAAKDMASLPKPVEDPAEKPKQGYIDFSVKNVLFTDILGQTTCLTNVLTQEFGSVTVVVCKCSMLF